MRRFIWSLLLLGVPVVSADAAWIWVYDGEKHVVMPPAEGRPAWSQYPDADADGEPDPIITSLVLRIETEAGESAAKTRVGKSLHLTAQPELGGLELEPVSVTFHLAGPNGEVEVTPDQPLRGELTLGTAPAVYHAYYEIPEEPVEDQVGDYELTVDLAVGGATPRPGSVEPARIRAVGPRESTSEKVKVRVKEGLDRAKAEIREFGRDIRNELKDFIAEAGEGPPPGSLRDVHRRETLGMAEKLAAIPTSPLAPERKALGLERAWALKSRKGPFRSLLVVPYDMPQPLLEGGWIPLGRVAMTGLLVPGAPDPAEASPGPQGQLTSYRLALEMEPGDVEGYVNLLADDGSSVARLPTEAEWFAKMVFPDETHARQKRHPGHEEGGLVIVKLVAPLPTGCVRVEFDLPVVGRAEAE